LLRPTIFTAGIICFAMSFDDFIISYFNSGNENTISVFLYSLKRVKPYVSAFATLLIGTIIFGVFLFNGFRYLYLRRSKIITKKPQ
jgi:spermidine/putrescine transport system permease protein